jgi:CheY-like chemotaxis protein
MALSGTNTSFTLDLPTDLKNIEGDWRQLNEVLTNIFLNASDSMPDGGRIHISGENFINSEEFFPNMKEGNYIKLSVCDHGTGIDKSIIDNIFDPFFSTKDKNRGLGLSSAHYIIQKHLGLITVESEPGKGSIFSIYLPSTDKPLSKSSYADILPEKPKIQNRILFMDDEELLRENMQDIGSLLDYEVVCACNGNEAVSLYQRELSNGRRFDAVILDLTVQGGMQGDEAIKELLKIDPEVKAIVFSGHSTKPIVSHYRDYGFKGRLDKPVTIESLVRTLNEVISNDSISN